MKSNRILLGLVLVLIVMNAVMLFMILKPGHHRPPHGHDFKQHVIKELDLNQEQITQYMTMVEHHQSEIRSIKQEEREILGNILEVAQSENQEVLEKAFERLGQLQKEKVQKTITHFGDLKAICNEEQLEAYPEIMRHAMKVLIGNNQKGRPHHKSNNNSGSKSHHNSH